MFREWVFLFMTILSLAVFVTLYWILPSEVDETIAIGMRGKGLEGSLEELAGEEGVGISFFETSDALADAVREREVEVGIDFGDSFLSSVASGEQTTVTVYAGPSLPPEYEAAMRSMVREVAFAVAGDELPVSEPDGQTVVLGVDRAGAQLPLRDKIRPMLAFMVLIMEAVALGTLVAVEVQQRTVVAILVTPARLGDVIGAKTFVGTMIAFSEAAIVTLLVRGFGSSPGIVVVALALGAIMVTGVALIAGSLGKELVGTMLFSMLFLLPLAIPAFAVLFPGSTASWVQFLPSYGLIEAIQVANLTGGTWSDVAGNLGILAGWGVLFAAAGLLVLRGRVRTL